MMIRMSPDVGPATGNPSGGSGAGAAQGAGNFATALTQDTGSGQGAPLASPAQGDVASQAAAGSGNATSNALPGWTSAATKELRSDQRFSTFASKFKSFDEVVKSALELETKVGSMVSIPDKDSPEEVRKDFWKKFGVPENPDSYELEQNQEVSTPPEAIAEFRKLAHSLNLSKAQASELWKKVQTSGASALKTAQEAESKRISESIAQTDTALKAEWGGEYAQNLGIMKRAIKAYGLNDLVNQAAKTGIIANKAFTQVLFELGKSIREDHSPASQPAVAAQTGERTFSY